MLPSNGLVRELQAQDRDVAFRRVVKSAVLTKVSLVLSESKKARGLKLAVFVDLNVLAGTAVAAAVTLAKAEDLVGVCAFAVNNVS